jgi:hypothetical protein
LGERGEPNFQYADDNDPKEATGDEHLQPPCNTKMSDEEDEEIQFENFNTNHLDN